jgi:hypothetical protein
VDNAHGIPYTGLSNARPETKGIGDRIRREVEHMPFGVEEFLGYDIPGSDTVGAWGDGSR